MSASDWKKNTRCGFGLHGLLAGAGNAELLDWSPEAVWMIVDITDAHAAGDVVDLKGKVKFPHCEIAHKGDQRSATQFLIDAGITGPIVGAFITAGYRGTATAGYGGTATAGYGGTATAGYGGTVQVKWWDGARYRVCTGYVGEDGIEANTAYRVENKKLVKA